MAKYEVGDRVTYYFVINSTVGRFGDIKSIQAWTDKKALAKFYMEFHCCKNFSMKEVTNTIEEINGILNECVHDEIIIRNIITKNPEKKGKPTKHISVPMTKTESKFIDEECNSMLSSMVSYSYLDSAIHYLKPKHQRALKQILMMDVISKAMHGKSPAILQGIELDQLMILYHSFPHNFGR